MGWTNDGVTTLTVPTGATSGARIVIDGTTGQILIYDAGNQLIGKLDPAGIEFLTGGAIVRMYEGTYTQSAGSDLVAGGYLTFQPPDQVGGTFSPGVIGSLSFAGAPPGSEMVIAAPWQAGEQQPYIFMNSSPTGSRITLENQGVGRGNFACSMDTVFNGGATVKDGSGNQFLPSNVGLVSATITGTQNVTSTAYANLAGLSTLSFTKMYSATRLLIQVIAGGWSQVGTGYQLIYGINMGGSDTDVGRYNFNTTADHRSFSGAQVRSGDAAGIYTVTGRVKLSAAGGTTTIDSADSWAITVTEIV